MKVTKCPGHASKQHIYKYNGNDYVCVNCGNIVKYDIMNRDFK